MLDNDGKSLVLEALFSQLSERAVPLIHDFIDKSYKTDLLDTEELFYSYFKLMNMSHPLMERWQKIAEAKEANKKRIMEEQDQLIAQSTQNKTVASQKVGRNDPCPCGSGKKYKKCCGK